MTEDIMTPAELERLKMSVAASYIADWLRTQKSRCPNTEPPQLISTAELAIENLKRLGYPKMWVSSLGCFNRTVSCTIRFDLEQITENAKHGSIDIQVNL